MTLRRDQMISHYRVAEKIGEGGMGEVYRAEDTRLARSVALKVLPEAFVQDGDRLARFAREAQLLAALNHPNIASIHGLEEADGIHALVLELVEGETLAERMRRGPIPSEEAVEIAAQIAEALEAAHDKGIIHRDLKPGNVKFGADGRVKVLDFGLAKAADPEQGTADSTSASMSPTLTAAMGTQAGVILGTAGYMSPEQARGKPVGRRADIWAFGVVLFEMLTGQKLFPGETATDIIAAVITREPDWTRLPGSTPMAIRRILRRCLEKDPRRRLCDMGDARLELIEPYTEMEARAAGEPGLTSPARRNWHMVAAGLAAGLLLAVAIFAMIPAVPENAGARTTWSQLLPPDSAPYLFEHLLEVSPDGRHLAFVAPGKDGKPHLWVRDLESENARLLERTAGASMPFWSPDSRVIGYFAGEKMRSIGIGGGVPNTICKASTAPRGASWGQDGTILFVPAWSHPVYRVPADGGTPQQVTKLDPDRMELSHRWPLFLPDGRHFIYYAVSTYPELNPENPSDVDQSGLYLGSFEGGPPRLLHTARSRAAYFQGSLLFVDDDVLMAQPFHLDDLALRGQPVALADGVTQSVGSLWGGALFSISDEGTLVFVRGASEREQVSRLVWRDRQGKEVATLGDAAPYNDVRLSHDGRRVATSINDPGDLWIFDLDSGSPTRFTFDTGHDSSPLWSPDDSQIIFNSSRVVPGKGFSPVNLFTRVTSGLEGEKYLHRIEGHLVVDPTDWSPDGRTVVVNGSSPGTGSDILLFSVDDEAATAYLQTEHNEDAARFSPDGRWIAYMSDESGSREVYIQSFPPSGGKWQVSSHGGRLPTWRADGEELFYIDDEKNLMAVPITVASGSRPGTPVALFKGSLQLSAGSPSIYDAAGDGQRFLFLEPVEDASAASATVTLVQNWPTRLSR